MNRRRFIRNLGLGSAAFSLVGMPRELFADDDFVTVSILHTNDIHSHVEPFEGEDPRYSGKGGLARIAGFARKVRQKNPHTLLFDAGDMFQGTPYFNYFKGELILKLMSAAGYDAGTLGNHEFDNGLAGILEPLPHARFPVINSNYEFSDTVLEGKFPRWRVFNRGGIRTGVYGLGIELDGLVSKKSYGNIRYLDPVKTALEMERYLKKEQECHLVVCLSHLGLRYRGNRVSDMVLAAETSFTDLIIGGHTHTYLEEPMEIKNSAGRPVIVNQAWWGGLVAGQIDYVFERRTKKPKAIFSNKLM